MRAVVLGIDGRQGIRVPDPVVEGEIVPRKHTRARGGVGRPEAETTTVGREHIGNKGILFGRADIERIHVNPDLVARAGVPEGLDVFGALLDEDSVSDIVPAKIVKCGRGRGRGVEINAVHVHFGYDVVDEKHPGERTPGDSFGPDTPCRAAGDDRAVDDARLLASGEENDIRPCHPRCFRTEVDQLDVLDQHLGAVGENHAAATGGVLPVDRSPGDTDETKRTGRCPRGGESGDIGSKVDFPFDDDAGVGLQDQRNIPGDNRRGKTQNDDTSRVRDARCIIDRLNRGKRSRGRGKIRANLPVLHRIGVPSRGSRRIKILLVGRRDGGAGLHHAVDRSGGKAQKGRHPGKKFISVKRIPRLPPNNAG